LLVKQKKHFFLEIYCEVIYICGGEIQLYSLNKIVLFTWWLNLWIIKCIKVHIFTNLYSLTFKLVVQLNREIELANK